MGRKKKIDIDKEWIKELAGTPEEQWDKAQREIAAAREKWQDLVEEVDKLVESSEEQIENKIYAAEDRIRKEGEEELQEKLKPIMKAQENAEKRWRELQKNYEHLRKNVIKAANIKERQKKKEIQKIETLKRSIFECNDYTKAIKILAEVKKLEKKLRDNNRTNY